MQTIAVRWYFVVGLGLLILLGFIFQIARGDKLEQPIAFNHQKHIQNHLACVTCHPLSEQYARAGMPGVKTCVRCHEDVIYRKPEKDKIQSYYRSNQEIPWQRVYRVKSHAYFSHRRHTAIAKLNCVECHGQVADYDKPITQPFMEIKMNNCLACHEEKQASVDCVDCHR